MKKIGLILLCSMVAACLPAQSPARTGKDYAVFFYVTEFQPGWSPLYDTKPEAEALKKELEINYGFQVKLVPNPKRQQILDELAFWNERLGPDDQVLFFFSMHGHYEGGGTNLGYLIPADGKRDDPYFGTWIDYNSLRPYFSRCKAKHMLVALDACYSGSFGVERGGPRAPIWQEEDDCASKVRKTFQYSVRQYACSGNKNAKTPGKSLFAAQFLEALQRNTEVMRFYDLAYWLGQVRSPQPVHGDFAGHEDGGDFVFVRKTACAPPITVKSTDRDGDGVPDATDACPDRYGPPGNKGCPEIIIPPEGADTDLDGIPDATDACPTLYGTAKARGCPDADDDGVPDRSDQCPYAPGEARWEGCPDTDGDGIPDHTDECPTVKGTAADKGCPPADRDNDGVPDKSDRCPDTYGRSNFQGCPDTDGDGIPDPDDQCPGEKGIARKNGCPDTDPLALIRVSGGTFTMGCSSEQQDCSDDEKPAHSVTVSDFFIGKYEVTQQLWQEIMGSNPSYFKDCPQCPVEQVSWDDVQVFLQKLNAKYPGYGYRLPTEAEWEYAARGGGKATLFGNGKNVADPKEINFDGDSYVTAYSIKGIDRSKTVPVGSLNSPNALGLHDMSGNVWEWCSDWYGNYSSGAQTNPKGPVSGSYRVLRGGSWYNDPRYCRVANRNYNTPGNRSNNIGFRLARTQ